MLIFFAFDDSLIPMWLPISALPYYLLLIEDLRASGYRPSYLPKVYSLNLLLVPVLIGGSILSLRQLASGRKAKFNRTPRTSGRTKIPMGYHAGIYIIFFYALFWATKNFCVGSYQHAVVAGVVALSYGYGIRTFMDGLSISSWLRFAGILEHSPAMRP
jgi:hypothetical protein